MNTRGDDRAGLGPAEEGVLAELGAVLLTEQTLSELLALVVRVARRTIPGADGVSLSVAQDGQTRTTHSSDDVVRELDRIQYEFSAGPCLEAISTGESVQLLVSSADDDRFAAFRAAADSRFITAVLAIPLRASGIVLGAINFYSGTLECDVLDQVELGELFARQVSILLANAIAFATSTAMNQHLQEALVTRERIGEAKGIIMARHRCSPDEAFDRLRIESQHSNRKLRDVAEQYVASIEAGVEP